MSSSDARHNSTTGKEEEEDAEFDLQAVALGDYALSTRGLDDVTGEHAPVADRAFHAAPAIASDDYFNIADENVFKSAPSGVLAPPSTTAGHLRHMGDRAPQPYRHMAPSAGLVAKSAPTTAAYTSKALGMNMSAAAEAQRSRAAAGLDMAMFSAESAIMPPTLPPPPYPLERHTYALTGTVKDVLSSVVLAMQRARVDADFLPSECRWECAVINGKRSCFHVFLHTVLSTGSFALEFQRRKGCSIVFNIAVRAILSNLAAAYGVPLEPFERSEEDKAAATKMPGFSVGSFDIPDVPLNLGIDFAAPLSSVESLLDDDDEDDVCDDGATTDRSEEGDGIRALLDMAGSSLGEVAEEGITGLSILSRGQGREALLKSDSLTAVAKCAVESMASAHAAVRCSAATLIANLTQDKRAQSEMVAAGCVEPLTTRAAKTHTASDAHIRREAVRALSHLAYGHADALRACGALKALTAASQHADHRLQRDAQRALQGLSA